MNLSNESNVRKIADIYLSVCEAVNLDLKTFLSKKEYSVSELNSFVLKQFPAYELAIKGMMAVSLSSFEENSSSNTKLNSFSKEIKQGKDVLVSVKHPDRQLSVANNFKNIDFGNIPLDEQKEYQKALRHKPSSRLFEPLNAHPRAVEAINASAQAAPANTHLDKKLESPELMRGDANEVKHLHQWHESQFSKKESFLSEEDTAVKKCIKLLEDYQKIDFLGIKLPLFSRQYSKEAGEAIGLLKNLGNNPNTENCLSILKKFEKSITEKASANGKVYNAKSASGFTLFAAKKVLSPSQPSIARVP